MDPHMLEQVDALEDGRAFVDGARLRAVQVTGGDAAQWLNDLVTAGLGSLAPGAATRSLLLTPTGRMRADVHVLRAGGGFVLYQETDQPVHVDDLLRPYVLSSDVRVDLLADAPSLVLVPSDRGWVASPAPSDGRMEASAEAGEVWRIRRGIPRYPTDLDEESLPAEAGLEFLIDFTKGCFLGQEAVAKVRNLGHPPRIVLALRAEAPLGPGAAVLAEGRHVGRVTSVAPSGAGFAVLARVRWESRSRSLSTTSGDLLTAD